jgi:hypothetical protein
MGSVTTLLNAPPRQIPAGDTLEYLEAIPADYVDWTGSARLAGPSTMDATSCVLEGGSFHIKFEGQGAGGTKELEPGQYTLAVFATSSNDRKTIAVHRLTVLPNTALVDDGRTFEAQMLDVINVAIMARVSGNNDGGIAAYAIDGVSITKIPLEELERLRTKYSNAVANQQSGGVIPTVPFVFCKTGGGVPYPLNFLGRGG